VRSYKSGLITLSLTVRVLGTVFAAADDQGRSSTADSSFSSHDNERTLWPILRVGFHVALPDLIETNQEAAGQAREMWRCGRSLTRFESWMSVRRLLESGHRTGTATLP
jgi:hypothetical protein